MKSGAITNPLPEETESQELVTEPVTETEIATGVPEPVLEPKITPAPVAKNEEPQSNIRTSMEDAASIRMQDAADEANKEESTMMSPTSGGNGRVKSWLKNKLSHRLSRGPKSPKEKEYPDHKEKDNSFQGGSALTGASHANTSTPDISSTQPTTSYTAPVLTGRPADDNATRGRKGQHADSEVSSLSSDAEGEAVDEEEFQEARDNFDDDLAPPPKFGAGKSSSPARDSRFSEDI
jgi:hypothetical protein